MTKRIYRAMTIGVLAGSLAGCEAAKSANPLSPSIAGPIPGVTISAPKLLEPGAGWVLESTQQPLTLLIENASTTGQRPLSYGFEVATDSGFSSKVFGREGVPQGDGGRTSLRLPDPLAAGRTYYWRARAQDGANTGSYSASVDFVVEAPVVLNAPVPVSPVGGEKIGTTKPTFKFRNAARSGPTGTVVYALEVSGNESFTARYGVWLAAEDPGGETTISPLLELPPDKATFWRVRGQEGYKGVISEWSSLQLFYTPAPPPPPPPSPGPGPGPSPGPGGPCPTSDKEALVRCIHAQVNPAHTPEGAFEVTKRVAWALRGEGGGLLIKDGGENVVRWRGKNFSASRICYPDGHIYKVLSDVPATNGPSWQDNGFVNPSLYVPAIDPSLP